VGKKTFGILKSFKNFIAELCKWENSLNPTFINIAREDIGLWVILLYIRPICWWRLDSFRSFEVGL